MKSFEKLLVRTPLRLVLAISAACTATTVLAQTALPPGVGVYLQNSMAGLGGGIGDSSYASSGTVTIYSGGGLQVDNPGVPGISYALTSPTTMPLGLTTATLSAIGSIPAYGGGTGTGTASATADLAGGVLRAATGSAADVPYIGVGPVSPRVLSQSMMQDYVTFSVASAAGADVVLTAHLDGSYALSDPVYANASVRNFVSFGGSFTYYGGDNSSGDSYGYNGSPIGSFSSYSFSNETATGFDFTGTLHVTDGQRVESTTALYLDCSSSSCDFSHTARIGLNVPTGVSFTSDSGVFLTGTNPVAAVPEPSTWALMLAGFAAVGRVARRRSRKARMSDAKL